MPKFYVDADIREINRYEFTVEAESAEEAENKLKDYLEQNDPAIFHTDKLWEITCDDRKAGITTEKTILVTAK
jgi:hypothetical protein